VFGEHPSVIPRQFFFFFICPFFLSYKTSRVQILEKGGVACSPQIAVQAPQWHGGETLNLTLICCSIDSGLTPCGSRHTKP